MNERQWPDNEDLSHELDLLIDGELNDARRRQLLVRLEGLADGWRRCALAFVENQCWRETMPDVVSIPVKLMSDSATTLSAVATPSSTSRLGAFTWFALAASFLLAFGLGIGIRDSFSSREIANQRYETSLVTTQPKPVTTNTIATKSPDLLADSDWAVGQSTGEIWLPTTDQGGDAADTELSAVLPTDLMRQLEDSGHHLEQKQELWPVELKDGRRAILPVDRLEVRYVGDGFQ